MAGERNGLARVKAFVYGTGQQMKMQKDAIVHGVGPWPPLKEEDCLANWDAILGQLQEGDYVVFTDLTVIPGDCAQVAERLVECIQRHIILYPLDEGHRDLLEQRQYYRCPPEHPFGAEERICKELEHLCQQGWQGNTKP